MKSPAILKTGFSLAIAAALLIASPAIAEPPANVSIHGTEVTLPIPPGNCLMSEKYPVDQERLSLVRRFNKGRNEVLAMFAPCRALKESRKTGGDLSGIGMYLAPASAAKKKVKMPRERFAQLIAKQLGDGGIHAKAQKEIKRRLKALKNAPSLEGNVDLGVLHKDRTAVFKGSIQNWAVEGGEPDRMVVIVGFTLVNRKVVTVQTSAPYDDQKSVTRALALQRGNVRRLIEAN